VRGWANLTRSSNPPTGEPDFVGSRPRERESWLPLEAEVERIRALLKVPLEG